MASNTGSAPASSANIPSSSGAQPKRPAQPPQQSQPTQQTAQPFDLRSLAALPSFSNAGGAGLPPNLQSRMNDVASATPGAVENAMATFAQLAQPVPESGANNMDPTMIAEVQEKLR